MENKEKDQTEEPEIYAIKKDKEGSIFSSIRNTFQNWHNSYNKKYEKIEDTGINISKFKAHSDSVFSVSFSPDGKMLASGSKDHNIKLWSIPNGRFLKTLTRYGINNSIKFSLDGKILASLCEDYIIIWSIPNGRFLKTLEKYFKINSVSSFSPDGKTLASGSTDKTIKIWSIHDGKLLKTLGGHTDQIKSVSFSPDGKTLASVAFSNIKLWSMPDGMLLKTIESGYGIDLVSFSPDGKTLACSKSWISEKTIKILSIPDGTLIKTLEGHTDEVTSLNFRPDGKLLASGSADKTIKIWSIPDGTLIKTLEGHTARVTSLSFCPDGKLLASGSKDHTLRLWSMPEGRPSYILFDPSLTEKTNVRQVKQMNSAILTLPCGSPIPVGATCICNCIAGSLTYPGTEMICTCNTITVPAETHLTGNMVCVCDTIAIGTYKESTNSGNKGTYYRGGSSYHTYYTTYWYPN